MFCMRCGTKLPNEAKFCFSCGQAQSPVTEPAPSETMTEHTIPCELCEITYTNEKGKWSLLKETLRFVAITRKNEQDLQIAASPTFEMVGFEVGPNEKNKKHQQALDILVEELIKLGWEPTPTKSKQWFNRQFQRKDV